MQRNETRWLVACLGLYLAISFFQLGSFPRVWADESWVLIPPATLAAEGRFVNEVYGSGTSFEEHHLGPAWFLQMPLAGAVHVFGMDLVTLRALPVLMGFLTLIPLYLLVRSHHAGPWTAAAVLLFTMADSTFFVASRTLRPEIHTAFVAVAAFYLLWRGMEHGGIRYWIGSGAVIGLGAITHPLCALAFAGLCCILLMEYGPRAVLKREVWLWILAAVIVVLPYVGYLVVEDLDNGFQDFFAQMTDQGRGKPATGGLVDVIAKEVQRYKQFTAFPLRGIVLLVNLAAVGFAWRRWDRLDRHLLILLAVHAVGFGVLFANKTARYMAVLAPFLAILTVKMIADITGPVSLRSVLPALRRLDRRVLAGLMVATLYFGNQAGGDAWAMWKQRGSDYDRFISEVRERIPEGARVWGALTFWIGLSDHPYRAEYTRGLDNDSFRPEYVILYDSDIWGGVTSTGRRVSSSKWRDVRERMEALAHQRGTSVGIVQDRFYGNVEIFRVDWNRATVNLPPTPESPDPG